MTGRVPISENVIEAKLQMLRQTRWRAMHTIAARGKEAEDELLRSHSLIVAIEATLGHGEPENAWDHGEDGYPLDPARG